MIRADVDLWGLANINNQKGKSTMHLMITIDSVSCWFDFASIRGQPDSFETIIYLMRWYCYQNIQDKRKSDAMEAKYFADLL